MSDKVKRDHVQLLGQYFANKGLWVLKMEMYGCRVIIIQIYALKRLSLLHLWLHLLGHLEQRVYLIRFSGSWQKYRLPITPPALSRLLGSLSLNQRNVMSPISRKPAKRKKEPREAPFALDTPRHDFTEKTMWRAVAWAVCPWGTEYSPPQILWSRWSQNLDPQPHYRQNEAGVGRCWPWGVLSKEKLMGLIEATEFGLGG